LEERRPCRWLLDSSLPEVEAHPWLPPHLDTLADAVNG
jgi:hypothetical protein